MFFDFCIRENSQIYRGIVMDTIFYIQGDKTYAVPHKEITPGKFYFVYTLSGEGILRYDDKSFVVHQNDFLFMQPNRDFAYSCNGSTWEFWWFEFTSVTPPPYANEIQHCASSQLSFLLPQQALMYAKFNAWDVSSSLFLSLGELLLHGAHISSESLQDEALVRSMEDYIRENIQTVTVNELQNLFEIEGRTLRNLFHRTVDMSPKHFIMKLRMELASHMLLSTRLPLAQLARELGFANQYHFSKYFKEYFGIPPLKYRKHIHQTFL